MSVDKCFLSKLLKLKKYMHTVIKLFYSQEVEGALDFLEKVYKVFGFTFKLFLSTRPEKYMGELSLWNAAEKV